MICPIKFLAPSLTDKSCLEGNCAWYTSVEQCAITSIGEAALLEGVAATLMHQEAFDEEEIGELEEVKTIVVKNSSNSKH